MGDKVHLQDGEVKRASFFCAGCDHPHSLRLRPAESPSWEFNGDVERPTFNPSVHSNPPGQYHAKGLPICHSWVRDGRIEYLADSTHALAGQTIDLPDFPEEWK